MRSQFKRLLPWVTTITLHMMATDRIRFRTANAQWVKSLCPQNCLYYSFLIGRNLTDAGKLAKQ